MGAPELAVERSSERPIGLTALRECPTPFAVFYATHYAPLRRFVGSRYPMLDAEEVAQEAMIRAMTHYDDLDHRRDPWPWISVIASNVARDLCRANQRHPTVDLESHLEVADVLASTPHELAETTESAQLLREALECLPAHQRALLLLRVTDDVEIADLADMFGVTANTIRQQLLRARRRMMRELVRLEKAAVRRQRRLSVVT